jgi:hypothetical protein
MRLAQAVDPKDGVKEYIKGDDWCGSAQACAALGVKGYKAFLQIKGHKDIYPKDFISENMVKTPGDT